MLFLVRKEFIQIRRDWRALSLTLVLPVAVLLLFGYAITLDIKDIPMAVVDRSNTKESRELARRFSGSGYFVVSYRGMEDAARMMEEREVWMIMVIPPGFSRDLGSAHASKVQLLVDGSNSNSSTIALGHAQGVLQEYAMDKTLGPVFKAGLLDKSQFPPVQLQPRVRFNPELESTTFIVPGLVAIIMMITVVVLSAMSVVRERELGTLETIMVSPLHGNQFILGKLIPYFSLGFADLFIILGAGVLFFGVPFRGSVSLLVVLSGLFIVGGLGMGLLISTLAETQRTAWMASLIATLLPSIILSGFIFPIRSMPGWLQVVTYAVPVRYYLVIVRGIVLKGAGVVDLWPQVAALVIFASIMIALSVNRFAKRLS